MKPICYKLVGKKPVPSKLPMWERVGFTPVVRGVDVSTVFLGIDHNFGLDGDPVLFETMVFGGKYNEQTERYSTYKDAVAGHKRWVKKVKEAHKS